MKLISVTRLRLRSVRFLPAFFWFAWKSVQQARQTKGNLKTKLVQDANLTFWTITAWEDEAAMRSFMMTGAHHQAMPKLLNWCDEASVVHWLQETDELPNVAEAHRRMVTEGRVSKVRHPSPNHTAHRIAKPS
jgi:quinol monooxygenase YgiN